LLLALVIIVMIAAPVRAELPLTPVIGVVPSQLDFACVPLGDSLDATAELFNAADDPLSLLFVTSISVDGVGFSLAQGPLLPVSIPGDTTRVELLIRFRPAAPGACSGSLSITAPDATNSPYAVLLTGETCADDDWQSVTGEY
jgi:hypothetical protein